MDLERCIANKIEPLQIDNKTKIIQQLFNELPYTHLPILDLRGTLLGNMSSTDALSFEDNKPLENYKYAIKPFFVRNTQQCLDVLKVFSENSTNIIPVLNDQNIYLGYYELSDVMRLFNTSPLFYELGDVLVIEKNIRSYTFSEISQIVESNDGKLLGAFISKIDESRAQITLKITLSGLNEIIQTFVRYDYKIVSQHIEDRHAEILRDRSDYLNKYLSI